MLGYAPVELPDDMKSAFDAVRIRSACRTVHLPQAVRDDKVDVFVEMSGWPPVQRHGQALCLSDLLPQPLATSRAERRLHHSDEMHAVRSRPQPTFTGNLPAAWLLLRYDYTESNGPPVSALPA